MDNANAGILVPSKHRLEKFVQSRAAPVDANATRVHLRKLSTI